MDKNLVPNLHIYISCHKMCYVPKFSFLRPIQVGTAISDVSLDMLHDDIGANISEKNRSYCELTAQYWAWKNDNDVDYYGFWHYRRYMSFLHRELPHNTFEDVEIPYLDSQSISYLYITKAVDYFDLAEKYGSLEDAFKHSDCAFLIISFSSDWLFPTEQSKEMTKALVRAGKDVSFCEIQSPCGHDAFLLEFQTQTDIIKSFLKKDTENE